MRRTILDTPVLTNLLRPVASLLLRLAGWRVAGRAPEAKKYVLVAAPHTSNFDGALLLMIAAKLRIQIFWLGKDSLFRRPFGPITRWLGGIPVDRSQSSDLVSRLAALFDTVSELVIVVPPEGTRSAAGRWKTGFYRIAEQASVPIGLGYLDYGTRTGGIGPLFEPTGELERDMARIREFYADKVGLKQEQFGSIDVS